MGPVEIIMEEYKALRAEIILCLQQRVTILSYGLATIGLLVGAVVAALNVNYKISAGIIAGLGIPIASLFVLNVWLAETRRVRRASWYNWAIELRLEKELGRKTLVWEQKIRKIGDKGLFFEHYYVIVSFFHAAALLSVVWGFILFWQSKSRFDAYFPWVSILATVLVVVLLLWHLWWAMGRVKWLRNEFDKQPPTSVVDV